MPMQLMLVPAWDVVSRSAAKSEEKTGLELDYYSKRLPTECSSSNLYFARVIPSIQTVLLSIGALEFKNLQYTFNIRLITRISHSHTIIQIAVWFFSAGHCGWFLFVFYFLV